MKSLNWSGWRRAKKVVVILGLGLIVLAAVITISNEALYQIGYYNDGSSELSADSHELGDDWSSGLCNIARIPLHGNLVSYATPSDTPLDETNSEETVVAIAIADVTPEIKGIMLDIDSSGGSPVVGQEIANALKQANKPTVALIHDQGLSAAYYAASGADAIFASSLSDVGSIGVTMSYLDGSRQNSQEGLTYNTLASGKFKDAGDPNKPLTTEERALFMRDINKMHQMIVKEIADNRKMAEEKLTKLADGSSMLGQDALTAGLVDQLGDWRDVENYLTDKTGEAMVVCE